MNQSLTKHELSPDEVARQAMSTPVQQCITRLRNELANQPQIDCPLIHRFTDNGLYTREIFMPAGTFIISKIHKTEHPYVILTGKVKVWIEGEGVQVLSAPCVGITKPGTRRVLEIVEDCRWLTFHPSNKKTPEAVEYEVIYDDAKDAASIIPVEAVQELQEAK